MESELLQAKSNPFRLGRAVLIVISSLIAIVLVLQFAGFDVAEFGKRFLQAYDSTVNPETPGPETVETGHDNGFNPGFAIGAMIISCLVFLFLGRRLLAESFRNAQGKARYQTALYAALVLSAISFFTTAVGLYEFTEPDVSTMTSETVSWILSYATTAGVQILMLVLALELGDEIVKLKPIPARRAREANGQGQVDKTQQGRNRRYRGQEFDFARNLQYALLIVIVATVTNLFGLWSFEMFAALIRQSDTQIVGAPRPMVIGLLLIVGMVLLSRLGFIRDPFAMVVLLFLIGVYGAALMVSSTFSFDAYYRFVQTEQQIKLEQESIISQETSRIISEAQTLLIREQARARTALDTSTVVATVSSNIGRLVEQSEQNQQKIADKRDELERDIAIRSKDLESERAALKASLDAALGARDRLEDEIKTMEARIPALQAKIPSLTATVDRNNRVAEQAREEAEDQKVEAEAQRLGLGDRVQGEGPLYEAAVRKANALEKTALERESEAADARSALLENDLEIEDLKRQIERQKLELAEMESGSGSTLTSVDRQGALAAREAELQDEANALKAQEKALRSADTTAVLQVFNNFISTPNQNSLSAYEAECNGLTKILIDVGVNLDALGGLQCVPGPMSLLTDRIFDLQERQIAFETRPVAEVPGNADATEAGSVDDAPTIAAPSQTVGQAQQTATIKRACSDGVTLLNSDDAFLLARRCIELVGADVAGQASLSNDLTQIQAIYSKPGYDIRKSVWNIFRGEPYAVVTVAFAVFIDLFILIAGVYIALANTSQLGDNPHLSPAIKIEEKLRRILKNLARPELMDDPTINPVRQILDICNFNVPKSWADRDFVAYIDVNQLGNARSTVDRLAASAGVTFVERHSESGGLEQIYLHVNFINFLEQIINEASDKQAAEPASNQQSNSSTRPIAQKRRWMEYHEPAPRRRLFPHIRQVHDASDPGTDAHPDPASDELSGVQSADKKTSDSDVVAPIFSSLPNARRN